MSASKHSHHAIGTLKAGVPQRERRRNTIVILTGDTLEDRSQQRLLGLTYVIGERGRDVAQVRADAAAQGASTCLRQEGVLHAPIVRARSPLDEAICREAIHEAGDAALRDENPLGEIRQAEPSSVRGLELDQDIELRKCKRAPAGKMPFQPARHHGVRTKERPPGRQLVVTEPALRAGIDGRGGLFPH